jgi:hypothetical protein
MRTSLITKDEIQSPPTHTCREGAVGGISEVTQLEQMVVWQDVLKTDNEEIC